MNSKKILLGIFSIAIITSIVLLSKPNTTNLDSVKYDVSGMTCQSCVIKIRESIKKDSKIKNVRVSLNDETLSFSYPKGKESSRIKIENLIQSMGYSLRKNKPNQSHK